MKRNLRALTECSGPLISNAHEALGYRLTFMRSEVSVTDSNSLMSDGRVHIVYKYVEGISRLKQKSKRPRPPALRAENIISHALTEKI